MKKSIFYLLSLTWGLPMTICGAVVALVLWLHGIKAARYGLCWHYRVGKGLWGGMNLGPVFLTQREPTERLKRHEHGHALQNSFMGPLILPFVILSVLRYHDRERRVKRGEVLPPYDAWWFEGQATKLGTRFIKGKEG